jgi:integrase
LRYQIGRIGEIQLQKLTSAMVEQWHAEMVAAGLAIQAIRSAHNLLVRCLDEAVRHAITSRNAARLQRPPRALRQEVEIVTQEQIADVLARLAGDPFHVPVVVALYCGLRRSEMLALTWADVDFDRRTLRIERALQETRAGITVGPTKSRRARTISLPEVATTTLREYRRQQLELCLQLGVGRLPDDVPIFPELPGFGFQSPRHFTIRWIRTRKRLGLPPIRWHAWRHTAVSLLIAAGLDIATIAKRMGHASPATTLAVYSHCFKQDDRAAADAIDRLAW